MLFDIKISGDYGYINIHADTPSKLLEPIESRKLVIGIFIALLITLLVI